MGKKINQLIDMQFPEPEYDEYEYKAEVIDRWLMWLLVWPFVLFSKIKTARAERNKRKEHPETERVIQDENE